jgi:hypothetical protein
MRTLLKSLKRLHHDQDGTALTEFTICLPVWIFIMIGISNLQALGLQSTRVQIIAQKNMWIAATDAIINEVPENMTRAGGAMYAAMDKTSATYSSTPTLDTAATVHGGAMALGHWVESGVLVTATKPLHSPSINVTVIPGTSNIGIDHTSRLNQREMPKRLLDDLNLEVFSGVGGGGGSGIVGDLAAMLLTTAGATIPLATAVRYGVVSGKFSGHQVQLTGGSVTMGAQYDVLVAPRPFAGRGRIEGARLLGLDLRQSALQPLLIARLLAEGVKNYEVHQRWGKSEWETSGTGSFARPDLYYEDDVRDAENEARDCIRGVQDHNNAVNRCRAGCNGDQSCINGCGSYRNNSECQR